MLYLTVLYVMCNFESCRGSAEDFLVLFLSVLRTY
jgi:hypothetical protein